MSYSWLVKYMIIKLINIMNFKISQIMFNRAPISLVKRFFAFLISISFSKIYSKSLSFLMGMRKY